MNEMTPEKWQEIKEIVANALEKPEEEQADYVRIRCAECQTDVGLVEKMLSAKYASVFASMEPPDVAGHQIGHYRVLRQLGQGGMGVVYLAQRVDEYQQEVTIKVLLPGLESDAILRRFLKERQFLANLNHPSIVQLIDGGTMADGTAYLVMEYVDGLPITEHCEQYRLDLRARLELFRELCAAVQFAHQHLVVHRDLKPSNILVTSDGHLKLLDFGVAKQLANDQGSGENTTMLAMTPEFASPEQIRGESVTTATDVYSLGILLYELLSGRRPFTFSNKSFHEMVHVICEQEPERPSIAASITPAKAGSSVITSAAWRRKLQGDLDTIVLMALRKEPERRYSSVERFREDISQYLKGLPVSAQPDTWSYRSSKHLRRNWKVVAAGLLLTLSVLAGSGVSYWQMKREQAARARADQRFADVHQLAKILLFDVHDQIRDLPGSTPIRKHIVEVAQHYLTELERDSSEDAELQREVALAYRKIGGIQGNPRGPNLGDSPGALASYRKALAIHENLKARGDADWKLDLLIAIDDGLIADILWDNDDPANVAYYQKSEQILNGLVLTHSDDPDVLHQWASIEIDLGDLCIEKKDYDCAEKYYKRSSVAADQLLALKPGDWTAVSDAALPHVKRGDIQAIHHDLSGALHEQRVAFAAREAYAKNHPDNSAVQRQLARSYADIANVQEAMGDLPLALASYQNSVDITRKLSAADPSNRQFTDDIELETKELETVKQKLKATHHHRPDTSSAKQQ